PGEPLPSRARLRIGTAKLRHGGVVCGLAFSPDGKLLASASHDQTVSVWEVPSGRERLRLRGHEADVLCVDFSPDGALVASGGADGVVRLWATKGDKAGREVHALRFKTDSILSLAFAPAVKKGGESLLAAGGDDGVVRLIDYEKATVKAELTQSRDV